MSRIVKVNWNKMRQMSSSSLKNADDFEEARENFLNIINSLNECWEGTDCKSFINNCSSFLNDLKNDTVYFEKIGHYFELGANKYNRVVNDNYKKIQNMNQEIIDKNVNPSQLDMAGNKYE